MQLPSVEVIKSWPASNFVNPEKRGPVAIITVSVLLGIVTILLAVRIYTRLRISQGFGWDDVLIMLAYVPTAAFGIVSFIAQLQFGWGKHIWDIPFILFTPGLQLNLASQLLFALATTLTKLSMLSLIYRVVSADNSRYKHYVTAVSAVVALDGLIFIFIVIFQCSPISAYWTLSTTPQKCINESIHLLAAGCINTTTDFLIVVLPIPYVMQLKLPRKQQVIIGSLFAGGIFVTAAGAVRTYIMFVLYSDPSKDLTWDAIPIILATTIELYLGIICASIPPIKPFFARYLPQLVGNPKNWVSRRIKTQSVTELNLKTKWDLEASWPSSPASIPLVVQIPNRRLMPGMPTPTRPPHTQSTYWARSPIDSPVKVSSPPSSGWTSGTSPMVSIPEDIASPPQSSGLNKPLPRIPSALRLDWLSVAEGEEQRQPNNSMSVYQFVPHQDGHISVHKTKRGGVGK